MTTLHAGGKFDSDSYKVSGGLHGVGVSVVNALSEWLEVEVARDGKLHHQRYERGKPKTDVEVDGQGRGRAPARRPGRGGRGHGQARQEGLASRASSNSCAPAWARHGHARPLPARRDDLRGHRLLVRHAGLAPARAGVPQQQRHASRSPTSARARRRRSTTTAASSSSCGTSTRTRRRSTRSPCSSRATEDTSAVEIALQYNDSYAETVFSFVNNINTVEGGTHLVGFRSALTRTLKNYAEREGMIKGAQGRASAARTCAKGLPPSSRSRSPTRSSRARPRRSSATAR